MFLRLHTKALSSKMIDGSRRMQDMDYFNFDYGELVAYELEPIGE